MEIFGWLALILVILAGLGGVAYLVTRDSLSEVDPQNFHYRDSQAEPLAPNLDRDFRTGQPTPGLPLVDLLRINRQLKQAKKPGEEPLP